MQKLVFILFSLIFIPGVTIYGQDKLYNRMKKQYPDQIAVVLIASENVFIDIEKEDFNIYANYHKDVLHLKETSKNLAKDKVYSTHFVKLKNIKAKTLVPHKKKYKTRKVENFIEKNEQSSGIFYDDMVSTSFVYPGVQPKSRTVLDYTHEITDPRVLRTFFFDSFIPVNESELQVKVHKDVKLNYKLFNTDNLDIRFSTSEKRNYKLYSWHTTKSQDFNVESDAPGIRYYAPHIVYYIEEAKIGENKIPVLKTTDDLYKWYFGFIKDINQEKNENLVKIVEKITQNIYNENDKAKKIFYWVQDNIKYIAFEDGMKGLVPQSAGVVCDMRYGDCKGMSSILYEMLSIAGIKAHFTWVGSRDLPYKYSEIPSPIVDNHMIVSYHNGEKYIFLDGTGRHTRYGLPTSMIQGKEALIGIDENNFRVETIPVVPKEMNLSVDSVVFTLNDEIVQGHGSLYQDGFHKVFKAYALSGLEEDREKDYVVNILERGNNKFFIDDYQISNLENREKPFQIEYNFTIEDYFKSIDDEIYLNLNLNKRFFNRTIDADKRDLPVEREFKHRLKFYTAFDIPAGYSVTYLPQNAGYQHELFAFSIDYKKKNNRIIQQKVIDMDFLILEKQHFDAWNAFISALNTAYREAIILKKNK